MGLVLVSPLVSVISGKVGNIVFMKGSQGGPDCRSRVIPANPQSADQLLVRNYLATAAQAWRDTLTQQQRDDWEVYASTLSTTNTIGATVNWSGIDAFCASYSLMLRATVTPVLDAPIGQGFAPVTTPSIALATGASGLSVTFTAADAWHSSGGALLIFQAPARPASQKSHKGVHRLAMTIKNADAGPTKTGDAIFVPGSDGLVSNFRYRVVQPDGQFGSLMSVDVIVST